MTTPTVEQVRQKIIEDYGKRPPAITLQDFDDDWVFFDNSLTTYGTARYEEGVQAGIEEAVSYIGHKQGWEESEDIYRGHFGLPTKYKRVPIDRGPSFATEEENDWMVGLGAPRLCKQCELEGNTGVCDKLHCQNYYKNKTRPDYAKNQKDN